MVFASGMSINANSVGSRDIRPDQRYTVAADGSLSISKCHIVKDNVFLNDLSLSYLKAPAKAAGALSMTVSTVAYFRDRVDWP